MPLIWEYMGYYGFFIKESNSLFSAILTIFTNNFNIYVWLKVQLKFYNHLNYKMKKENEYDSLMNQKVNICK